MIVPAAIARQAIRMLIQPLDDDGGCRYTVTDPGHLGDYIQTIAPEGSGWKTTMNSGDLEITEFFGTRADAEAGLLALLRPHPVQYLAE